MTTGLTNVSSQVLSTVLGRLDSLADDDIITQPKLANWGLSEVSFTLIDILGEKNVVFWRVVIEAVLEERAHAVAPPELVWTGDSYTKNLRATPVVIRQLIASAQTHILVTIYSYQRGEKFISYLVSALERGIIVDVYLNLSQSKSRTRVGQEVIDDEMHAFLEPFGSRRPHLFYDDRFTMTEEYFSLHAKCLVIDGQTCFIGSANFTERGSERNVELGLVVDDMSVAKGILAEFRAPYFCEWEG